MAFDPKAMIGSQAFSTAGGVLLGLGLFWFVKTFFEAMVQPFFHLIFDGGVVWLSQNRGAYFGCASFIGAGLILVACAVLGFVMIKAANK